MVGWLLKALATSSINAGVNAAVRLATTPSENTSRRPVQPTTQTYMYRPTFNHYTFQVDTKNKQLRNEKLKDLNSCISFFEEGLELLLTSIDRIESGDGRSKAVYSGNKVRGLASKTDMLATLDRDVFSADVDQLKSLSKESFDWAKSYFRAARDDATRAFNNEALDTDNRLLAARVRIVSAIFGCLDEPETAAVACKMYLKELNALPCISKVLSNNFKNINNGFLGCYEEKSKVLTCVAYTNYFVFHFAETLARHVLHEHNWPRLKATDTLCVHPIRSVGLRALTEKIEESNCGIDSESISFNVPIDATDMAVNSAGEFIVVGLDSDRNAVVIVYSDTGEFRFVISPTKEESNGNEFQPRVVFTDNRNNIYVYTETGQAKGQAKTGQAKGGEDASLFVFNEEGTLQRILSTERGFMALEKNTGKIFISNEKGVFVYENSGKLLRNFAAPEPLRGSACLIAVCEKDKIILTCIHDPKVYLLTDSGTKIQPFIVKQARGWKYVAFNHVSEEIIVSYLSKNLSNFQLDAYLRNGQLLGTVQLPDEHSSHPRCMSVTLNGQVAVLYENVVHLF